MAGLSVDERRGRSSDDPLKHAPVAYVEPPEIFAKPLNWPLAQPASDGEGPAFLRSNVDCVDHARCDLSSSLVRRVGWSGCVPSDSEKGADRGGLGAPRSDDDGGGGGGNSGRSGDATNRSSRGLAGIDWSETMEKGNKTRADESGRVGDLED